MLAQLLTILEAPTMSFDNMKMLVLVYWLDLVHQFFIFEVAYISYGIVAVLQFFNLVVIRPYQKVND